MSLARVWAMADKEARYLLRDWRSLTVTLLLPVMLLVLFGYAIDFDVRHIALATYDPAPSQDSRSLTKALTASGYFDLVETLPSPDAADAALQTGRVSVVLVFPTSFSADLAAGRTPTIQTLVNGADSLTATVSLSYLDAMTTDWALRQAQPELPPGVEPVAVRPVVRVWYYEVLSSRKFIIPGLVVLLMMMLAALLTSQTVVREREQGTIEGLVVSPVTAGELILGKLLPYVAIALADVATVAAVGLMVFHAPMRGGPALLLGLMLVYLLAALGAGLLISVSTRTQQSAFLAAFVATLLPTMLLTGFVFPVSSMPKVLQALVQLHPATHFMVIVRAIALKGAGMAVLWPRAAATAALAAALLGASVMRFRKAL